MGKVSMALGLGVGYVLGTRAGRERFEELKKTGARLVQRPEVQQAKERIRTVASERLPVNGARSEPRTSAETGPRRLSMNDSGQADSG